MKICVTANGGSLEASVDPRFGRASHFVIVDLDTMMVEAVPNMAMGVMSGAGIQAAQTIARKGVTVVITGNVGPNAYQALTSAGIKIMIGASGTVKEVIEKYKRGEFKEASTSTVGGHFGRRGGMGRGRGQRRRL